MTEYTGQKTFCIHPGDIGSEAYEDKYVHWLEERLRESEARTMKCPHGHDHLVDTPLSLCPLCRIAEADVVIKEISNRCRFSEHRVRLLEMRLLGIRLNVGLKKEVVNAHNQIQSDIHGFQFRLLAKDLEKWLETLLNEIDQLTSREDGRDEVDS